MKLPVMAQQCATCPFRNTGYTCVRPLLSERALTQGTPICHSTGIGALSKKKLFNKAHACRGARDLQLQIFYRLGFIEAATDEAWDKKFAEIKRKKK